MSGIPLIAISGGAGVGKDTVGEFICKHYGATRFALADPIKRLIKNLFNFPEANLWGESPERNKVIPVEPVDDSAALAILRDFLKKDVVFHGNIAEACLGFNSWYTSIKGKAQIKDSDKSEISVRQVLQTLGTEFFRDRLDPDIWTNTATKFAFQLFSGEYTYDRLRGTHQSDVFRIHPFVVITDCRFVDEVIRLSSVGGTPMLIKRPPQDSYNFNQFQQHKSERGVESMPNHFFDMIVDNNGTLEDLETTVKKVMDECVDIPYYYSAKGAYANRY